MSTGFPFENMNSEAALTSTAFAVVGESPSRSSCPWCDECSAVNAKFRRLQALYSAPFCPGLGVVTLRFHESVDQLDVRFLRRQNLANGSREVGLQGFAVVFNDGVFALLGRDQKRVIAAHEPGLDASPCALKGRCCAIILPESAHASLAEDSLQLVDKLRAQQ